MGDAGVLGGPARGPTRRYEPVRVHGVEAAAPQEAPRGAAEPSQEERRLARGERVSLHVGHDAGPVGQLLARGGEDVLEADDLDRPQHLGQRRARVVGREGGHVVALGQRGGEVVHEARRVPVVGTEGEGRGTDEDAFHRWSYWFDLIR